MDPEKAPGDQKGIYLYIQICSHSGHLFIEKKTYKHLGFFSGYIERSLYSI